MENKRKNVQWKIVVEWIGNGKLYDSRFQFITRKKKSSVPVLCHFLLCGLVWLVRWNFQIEVCYPQMFCMKVDILFDFMLT